MTGIRTLSLARSALPSFSALSLGCTPMAVCVCGIHGGCMLTGPFVRSRQLESMQSTVADEVAECKNVSVRSRLLITLCKLGRRRKTCGCSIGCIHAPLLEVPVRLSPKIVLWSIADITYKARGTQFRCKDAVLSESYLDLRACKVFSCGIASANYLSSATHRS